MAKSCIDILLQCFRRRHTRDARGMVSACENAEETAVLFVGTLYDSKESDKNLKKVLCGIYLANNWKPNFAQAVFDSLQKAIETAHPMGDAFRRIYDQVFRVVGDNKGFEKDISTFNTVMALGILIVESPEVIRDLGLGKEGFSEVKDLFPAIRSQACRDANAPARLFCGKGAIEDC